jgi:hypothetical protein
MVSLIRRARLARAHRWLAVALSPVLALILISGIVLAARPSIVARRSAGFVARPVDAQRLLRVVARLDSTTHATLFALSADHRRFVLGTGGRPPIGPFDVVTGARVVETHGAAPTWFDRASAIHGDLGIGQGWLVALGSVALVIIAGVGPFMSRNAGRGTILGGHVRAGWLLMPLVLWLPATLVMMRLDFPVHTPRDAPTVPIASALRVVSARFDLRDVAEVFTLPGWTFVVVGDGTHPPVLYRLQGATLTPLKGPVARLGYTLHSGDWGGPLGGIVNASAALVMLWMLGTGLLSTWRRGAARRVSRRQTPRFAGPPLRSPSAPV